MSHLLSNSNRVPFAKSAHIDQYRRKCKFVPSKFDPEIKSTPFVLPGDQPSPGQCGAFLINDRKEPIIIIIDAEFDDNILHEKKEKVLFKGPKLVSTCTIPDVQKKSCHREFGYIQTSTLFSEGEFTNGFICSDFHANLLHNQDEVLDSDLENYPFYSSDSYWKVPADEDPPNEIEMELSDSPLYDIQKMFDCSSKHKLGSLKQLERYQQFFVYLVMRSKEKNEENWKYDVLYSFDWFIYIKWIRATDTKNNIYEYNYGIIKEVRKLPELSEYYVCNDDQFYYWIDRKDGIFNIDACPDSIFKNELEKIYDNIENKILETRKLYKDYGDIDAEGEVREHVKNISLERNEVREQSEMIISMVKEMFELMEREISKRITSLNREVKKLCKSDERKSISFGRHNICANVMILKEFIENMRSKINKFYDNYVSIDLRINELFKYFVCIDSKEDEIYKDIEGLLAIVKVIMGTMNLMRNNNENIADELEILLANIDKLLPEIEKLNKDIEDVYLGKYEFSENFRCIFWAVKRWCDFIKYLDFEVKKYLEGMENMDSEGRKKAIENSKMKLFNGDNIDLRKHKFCNCNNLQEKELRDKLETAIIQRNNHEKNKQTPKVEKKTKKSRTL